MRPTRFFDQQWAFILRKGGAEWLRDLVDEKMQDEPEVAAIDVEVARRALVEAEARFAQTKIVEVDRDEAAWQELVAKGIAAKTEKRFRAFITGPAGRAFLNAHSMSTPEKAIELYRRRRGMKPLVAVGGSRE